MSFPEKLLEENTVAAHKKSSLGPLSKLSRLQFFGQRMKLTRYIPP